ncbi:MAG: hypothetical protein II972_05705 [Elusimicrobiaceae bacterium]|nr:hypothetical protein [Elusimicrobiaceae bacterium]
MNKSKKVVSKKTATKVNNPALSQIKEIYKFMQDNDLGTIDFEDKGTRVRLVRSAPAQIAVPVVDSNVSVNSNLGGQKSVPAQYPNTIKSPLMGIFFRGVSPSAPPFVREGEKVKAGEAICLIEAMKVFNEVKATQNCVIKKVLVDNGQPVKPGDPLFAIEKI